MDSDSDSDCSHVSATPPRVPLPQPPLPMMRTTTEQVSFESHKSTKTSKTSSSRSKSINPLPPNPVEEAPRPSPSSIPSHLLFQIRRPSDQHRAISDVDSFEAVSAGFFSFLPSFSRIRRASLTFEADKPRSELQTDASNGISEPRRVVNGPPISVKRKHPNLIVDATASPPVKVPKSGGSRGSEGNFVKLNLNGKRRKKFPSKYKGASKSGRKSTYRRIRYKKAEGEGEIRCADEPVLEEMAFQQQKQEEEEDKGFISLVEDVILAVRNEASDENLVRLLNVVYGYDSFRDGQLQAIKLILSGSSTMLVLPTGAGKSLCYQIPAMILPGITLVVSPLVALMIDQLKHLPSVIQGGLLSSSQRPEEVTETLRRLKEGTIKVLFVSPERFLNAKFLSMFPTLLSVSLVVVDEAHCISEWSHNFRPSYMRLRASVLRSKLNVQCIFAMTATATTMTLQTVMSALEIPSANLIKKSQIRDNLKLSVSPSGANRMKDLLLMIRSPPFNEVRSIIVYCKFQNEVDTISKYLHDNNIVAKGYHSGLSAKDRKRIQELFCSNKIRVVVATVAFGMGLDKKDVGAVIHYSLPGSLEEYIQEIGRAGRDGRLSYCHLFYDDQTYMKLRSLAHSDGVDEYAVGKFLTHVFSTQTKQHGKICTLVVESTSRKFDMKEEVMLTLLTHLELGEVQYLHMLPQLNASCTLNFHKSSPSILAERNSVVSAILKKSQMKQGLYMFDLPNVANSIGVTATEISAELQNLKMKGEITYETKDPAFCYTIKEFPRDICSLSSRLAKWFSEIEACKVRKLDAMSNAAVSVINSCGKTQVCPDTLQTPLLQRKILDYFKGDEHCDPSCKMTQNCRFLQADIKVFLQSNPQAKFTPRTVARILHGISSPAYPPAIWSKTHFWGRYMHVDFHLIMEAAKAELLNFVDRNATLPT